MDSNQYTKTQAAMLAQVKAAGGIPVSEWTSGMGRYTKRKAIPPHCAAVYADTLSAFPKRVHGLKAQRPRVREWVIVADMRAANALLKEKGVAL